VIKAFPEALFNNGCEGETLRQPGMTTAGNRHIRAEGVFADFWECVQRLQ
jgi:hypothetical protein